MTRNLKEPKTVWIKCRVKIDGLPGFKCSGNQATLLKVSRPQNTAGTKLGKYKCLTCERVFLLSS